jgi:hypothetical protein
MLGSEFWGLEGTPLEIERRSRYVYMVLAWAKVLKIRVLAS